MGNSPIALAPVFARAIPAHGRRPLPVYSMVHELKLIFKRPPCDLVGEPEKRHKRKNIARQGIY